MNVEVIKLGLIPYSKAHQLQLEKVNQVIAGESNSLIFTCSHPSIVTLGKQSEPEDLQGWQGETLRVERGGRATYHGPQQLIIYPILDLKQFGQNLGGLLRSLERATIKLLEEYGKKARGNPSYAGVFVGDKKIASIGIAVKRWVSYHGLALNLAPDPIAFNGIRACGMEGNPMSTLQEIIGREVNRDQIEQSFLSHFQSELSDLA